MRWDGRRRIELRHISSDGISMRDLREIKLDKPRDVFHLDATIFREM